MVDITDPQTRSSMMAAIGRQNTGPEIALRRLLWACGLKGYRLHRKDIPGTPDLAWVGEKLAIFVDGAFWHGHPSAFTPGKSGAFWDEKLKTNVARDRRVNEELREAGWTVLRFWDFEIEQQPDEVVRRVAAALGRELDLPPE